jgi:thioredoxin reductase
MGASPWTVPEFRCMVIHGNSRQLVPHDGIFWAGDVRHDSIKRVASGVGEGSMAIAFVHQYLALQQQVTESSPILAA